MRTRNKLVGGETLNYHSGSSKLGFTEQDLQQINRRIAHNRQAQKTNKENGIQLMNILIGYKEQDRLRQLESISLTIFGQLIYTFGLSDAQIGEIFDRSEQEIQRYHFKCDLLQDKDTLANRYTMILPIVDVLSFAEYFRVKI